MEYYLIRNSEGTSGYERNTLTDSLEVLHSLEQQSQRKGSTNSFFEVVHISADPPLDNNPSREVSLVNNVLLISVAIYDENGDKCFTHIKPNQLDQLFKVKSLVSHLENTNPYLFEVIELPRLPKLPDNNDILYLDEFDNKERVRNHAHQNFKHHFDIAVTYSDVEDKLSALWTLRLSETKEMLLYLQNLILTLEKSSNKLFELFKIERSDVFKLVKPDYHTMATDFMFNLKFRVDNFYPESFYAPIIKRNSGYTSQNPNDSRLLFNIFTQIRPTMNSFLRGSYFFTEQEIATGKKVLIRSDDKNYLYMDLFFSRDCLTSKFAARDIISEVQQTVILELIRLAGKFEDDIRKLEAGFSYGYVKHTLRN